MEEIREPAIAYYENGSQEQKQLAWDFFSCLDVDGDGTVSVHEFVNVLSGRGYGLTLVNYSRFFQELDRDGNGSLDFVEVLTFYYVLKSHRPFCDGCRILLKGLFFTCVKCHESCRNDTFHLCSACYRAERFNHQHAAFLDNYTSLAHERLITVGGDQGHPNTSQEKLKEAFEAFDTVVTIGTYAANVCSIL